MSGVHPELMGPSRYGLELNPNTMPGFRQHLVVGQARCAPLVAHLLPGACRRIGPQRQGNGATGRWRSLGEAGEIAFMHLPGLELDLQRSQRC